MLFFTVLVHPKSKPLPRLYEPEHQVMPFDAVNKLVTHNFFPDHLDPLIEFLLKCYLDWSSHLRFHVSFVNRIAMKTTPPSNLAAATTVMQAVRDVLAARKRALNTSWTLCADRHRV